MRLLASPVIAASSDGVRSERPGRRRRPGGAHLRGRRADGRVSLAQYSLTQVLLSHMMDASNGGGLDMGDSLRDPKVVTESERGVCPRLPLSSATSTRACSASRRSNNCWCPTPRTWPHAPRWSTSSGWCCSSGWAASGCKHLPSRKVTSAGVSPVCCSSASTMPVAPRWHWVGSESWPAHVPFPGRRLGSGRVAQ